MSTRSLGSVLATVLLCWVLPAWGQGSAEDKAKPLVDAKCNSCHPLAARTGSGYTLEGWKTVMRMMTNHGVAVAPDEIGPITDYLAKMFPVKRSPAVLVPGMLNISIKSCHSASLGLRPHDS